MIAITFAVPHESADVRRHLRDAKMVGADRWITGTILKQQVIIAHTGIGTAAAEKCVEKLLADHHPRWLLSSGYAGALDPAIPHSSLFLAENFSSPELFPSAKGRRGTLTTQPRAAETPEQKAALARDTGAQAVDMETSAIARVCASRGVPMLSLRAISDTASAEIPVPLHISYDMVKQRPRVIALVAFLARNPSRIRPFARFVRGLGPARETIVNGIMIALSHESERHP